MLSPTQLLAVRSKKPSRCEGSLTRAVGLRRNQYASSKACIDTSMASELLVSECTITFVPIIPASDIACLNTFLSRDQRAHDVVICRRKLLAL